MRERSTGQLAADRSTGEVGRMQVRVVVAGFVDDALGDLAAERSLAGDAGQVRRQAAREQVRDHRPVLARCALVHVAVGHRAELGPGGGVGEGGTIAAQPPGGLAVLVAALLAVVLLDLLSAPRFGGQCGLVAAVQHPAQVDRPAQPVELSAQRALGVLLVVQVGVEAALPGQQRLDQVGAGLDGAGDAEHALGHRRGDEVELDLAVGTLGSQVNVSGGRLVDLVPADRERDLVTTDLENDRRAPVLVTCRAHFVGATQPGGEIHVVAGGVRGCGDSGHHRSQQNAGDDNFGNGHAETSHKTDYFRSDTVDNTHRRPREISWNDR